MKNRLSLNIFSVLHISLIFNVGLALIVGMLVKNVSPVVWAVLVGVVNILMGVMLGFIYRANGEQRTFLKSIVITFFSMQLFYLILYMMRFPGYTGRGFLFIPTLNYSDGLLGLVLSKLEILLGILFVPFVAELVKRVDFKYRFKRKLIVICYFELVLFYEFVIGLVAGFIVPSYELNALFIVLVSVPMYVYYLKRSRKATLETKVQLTLAAAVSYLPLLIGVIFGLTMLNQELFSTVLVKAQTNNGFSPLVHLRVLSYISLFVSIVIRLMMVYAEDFKKTAIFKLLQRVVKTW